MFTALLILQVVLGLSIIALVLLQQGKGADMGAAFGAGASGSVFGARGGSSFFTRATAVLATAFFVNSILLSSPIVHEARDPGASVTSSMPAEETEVPAADEAAELVVDLPPSDLPELDNPAEDTVSDLPEAVDPVEEPAPASDKP